jgi:hypothetical protein
MYIGKAKSRKSEALSLQRASLASEVSFEKVDDITIHEGIND